MEVSLKARSFGLDRRSPAFGARTATRCDFLVCCRSAVTMTHIALVILISIDVPALFVVSPLSPPHPSLRTAVSEVREPLLSFFFSLFAPSPTPLLSHRVGAESSSATQCTWIFSSLSFSLPLSAFRGSLFRDAPRPSRVRSVSQERPAALRPDKV